MILTIHTKPNAKQTTVINKLDDRTFIIAVHAPAIDGQANEELLRFLAEKLNIAKTFLNLKRGQRSRVKHVEIPNGTKISL